MKKYILSLLFIASMTAFAQSVVKDKPIDVPPTDQPGKYKVPPTLPADTIKKGTISHTDGRPSMGSDTNKTIKGRGNTLFYIGAGYNILSKTTKNQAFLSDVVDVHLSIYQPILVRKKITFGIQMGVEYGIDIKDNLPGIAGGGFHVPGETSGTVAFKSSGGKQSALKIEAGPQLNIHIGKHVVISPSLLVGARINFGLKEFYIEQTTVFRGITRNYILLQKTNTKPVSVALTPKLRLHYMFNKWIGLWAEVNYAVLSKISASLSTFKPEGTPDDEGMYNFDQLENGTIATEQRTTKFSAVGVNAGLVFSSGGKKDKTPYEGIRDVPQGDDEGSLGINSKTITITCDIGNAINDCKTGGGLCNCRLGVTNPTTDIRPTKTNGNEPINRPSDIPPTKSKEPIVIVILSQPPPNQRSMTVNVSGKNMYVHFVDPLPGDASVFVFDTPTPLDNTIAKELGYKRITIQPGNYKVKKEGKGIVVKLGVVPSILDVPNTIEFPGLK